MPSPSETWCRDMRVGESFPAGVGPSSLSRNAANWLFSRLDQSAETRRQYGRSKMMFLGPRLIPAPIWCTSGGGGTREAGCTVAESLVPLYRVGPEFFVSFDWLVSFRDSFFFVQMCMSRQEPPSRCIIMQSYFIMCVVLPRKL